eukprot:gene3742-4264_t
MAVIIWSLLVITISITLCQILRFITRRIFSEKIFKLIDEFLAAFQTSICILEVGVISSVYGFASATSIIYLFMFGVIKHYTYIRGQYVANPVCFIDSFYNAGKACVHSPYFITYVIVAQIVAALLAHPFVKLLWGRTYSENHNQILFTDCKTTLEVPFFHGFVVEILTTMVAWTSDYFTPVKLKPPVRTVVCLALAFIFDGTSGVWMNPAAASAHTFNCKGHDNMWEHIITYWLGPFIAVIMFYEIKEVVLVIRDKQSQRNMVQYPVPKLEDRVDGDRASRANGVPGVVHQKKEIVTKEIKEYPSVVSSQNKYHRSPGGSLRPRIRPNIGPG